MQLSAESKQPWHFGRQESVISGQDGIFTSPDQKFIDVGWHVERLPHPLLSSMWKEDGCLVFTWLYNTATAVGNSLTPISPVSGCSLPVYIVAARSRGAIMPEPINGLQTL